MFLTLKSGFSACQSIRANVSHGILLVVSCITGIYTRYHCKPTIVLSSVDSNTNHLVVECKINSVHQNEQLKILLQVSTIYMYHGKGFSVLSSVDSNAKSVLL